MDVRKGRCRGEGAFATQFWPRTQIRTRASGGLGQAAAPQRVRSGPWAPESTCRAASQPRSGLLGLVTLLRFPSPLSSGSSSFRIWVTLPPTASPRTSVPVSMSLLTESPCRSQAGEIYSRPLPSPIGRRQPVSLQLKKTAKHYNGLSDIDGRAGSSSNYIYLKT